MKFYKSKLLLITIFASLTACGGGSGSVDSSTINGESQKLVRPYTEAAIAFEAVTKGVFLDKYEEHWYEFSTDQSAVINLEVESGVIGVYYVDGDSIFNTIRLLPHFYFLDYKGDIITSAQSRDSDIEVSLEPGDYYLVVNFPLQSGTSPLRFLDSSATANLSGSQAAYLIKMNNLITEQTISGTEGNDILKGYDADQLIYGRGGDDEIYGMNGSDTIFGGLGNDVIYGGNDADSLTGGVGRDVFAYKDIIESGGNELQRDTIEDFTPGEDFIDVSEIKYDGTNGYSYFSFSGTNFYIGTPPDMSANSDILWFKDQVLYGKLVHNPADVADFSIALPGVVTLSKDDMIFN
jgi:hypothetical protein